MSVRYTAEAIMNGPALGDVDRDGGNVANGAQRASVDRWREKIEVRLDNRQVFFLFFGSALVACMLFVLGVMVGKRIESRGQAEAPVLTDPLAALDRARQIPPGVAAPDQPLSFQNTLVSGAGSSKARAAHLAMPAPAAKPAIAKTAPAAPRMIAAAPPKAIAPPPPKPLAPAAPKTIAAAVKPAAAPADPTKVKGRFTLHLSTFATAADADAFAQKYPGAFVVAGAVPGKGMAYRVRFGNYASFKEATAAKDAFEKQHATIALVAAR
jgi:DedD protein